MKKIILLPLLVLMTFINYSQNQELLDNSWFVHSARDHSTSNNIFEVFYNTNPELRFSTTFLNNKIIVHGCCGGKFEVDINYISNDELEIINLTETEATACNVIFITNFYNTIKGAFTGMIGMTIIYNIDEISEPGISILRLDNPDNNSFVEVFNTPSEINIPYWGYEPPDHIWSLTAVHYQGEFYELPYGVAYIATDVYEGTFTISICGEIFAAINFTEYLDVEWAFGPCFISCGILENTSGVCEPVEGYDESYLESIKQNVFDFLNDNINQTMEYEFTLGSARKLVIEHFSQNKLIFYNNDSYLNTTDHNLSEFKVYPNPVSEILYLESGTHEITKMSLYDINGKLLQTLDTSIQEIDVRNLNNGLYFLVLESATGETVVRKFLKR